MESLTATQISDIQAVAHGIEGVDINTSSIDVCRRLLALQSDVQNGGDAVHSAASQVISDMLKRHRDEVATLSQQSKDNFARGASWEQAGTQPIPAPTFLKSVADASSAVETSEPKDLIVSIGLHVAGLTSDLELWDREALRESRIMRHAIFFQSGIR